MAACAAMATLLNKQNPLQQPLSAWWPGGLGRRGKGEEGRTLWDGRVAGLMPPPQIRSKAFHNEIISHPVLKVFPTNNGCTHAQNCALAISVTHCPFKVFIIQPSYTLRCTAFSTISSVPGLLPLSSIHGLPYLESFRLIQSSFFLCKETFFHEAIQSVKSIIK